MVELTFPKVLMSIRHVNQMNIIYYYWYFSDKGFKFQQDVSKMGVMIY